MLESIILFIKSLPVWLGHVVEVLFVAIVFMTAITFLAGIWCGLRIIGQRSKSIKEITFFPPKIVFEHDENTSFDK
jgi:hypothetical protein